MVPLVVVLLVKEMPIAVHVLRTAISQTNVDLTDTARLAGASWLTIFWRILLPAIAPALMVVFLLCVGAALRDVSAIILIAPPDLQTLSLLTFSYASVSAFEGAAVTGTILAILSLAVSALTYRFVARIGFL
jgi:ABC-type Fe3+ transport system permease subunit